MSSAEKYLHAKAMLEPLFEHLSHLSRVDSYQELSAWKETVEIGLKPRTSRSVKSDLRASNTSDDEIETDEVSVMYPAEAIGTLKLMYALKSDTANTDHSTDAGCRNFLMMGFHSVILTRNVCANLVTMCEFNMSSTFREIHVDCLVVVYFIIDYAAPVVLRVCFNIAKVAGSVDLAARLQYFLSTN